MAALRLITSHGADLDPKQWDAFIEASPQGAVFLYHGYMRIVSPGWKCLIVKEGDCWKAVLPFADSTRMGLRRSLQPRFAQYWGVCFAPTDRRGYHKISHQKAILELMIPAVSEFRQIVWNFSPACSYVLPFYWAGFRLNNRYTYQIHLEREEAELLSDMAPTTRRYIRKGANLSVSESFDTTAFLSLFARQKAHQHEIISSHVEEHIRLKALVEYLCEKGKGKLILVKNSEGQVLAGGLFGFANQTCTYLLGTYDPDQANRSAMPLMMWHMIRHSKQQGLNVFDFEGSMMKGVERFFRRMGGQPVPYLRIEKNELPLLIQWILALRS